MPNSPVDIVPHSIWSYVKDNIYHDKREDWIHKPEFGEPDETHAQFFDMCHAVGRALGVLMRGGGREDEGILETLDHEYRAVTESSLEPGGKALWLELIAMGVHKGLSEALTMKLSDRDGEPTIPDNMGTL